MSQPEAPHPNTPEPGAQGQPVSHARVAGHPTREGGVAGPPASEAAAKKPREKLIDATTWKFAIVGVINTIVGTTVMFLAYNWLGFGYWVSSALNYIIGSIVSFFLNKYFTFQNKERSLKQVVLFIANITICYLLAYGMAKPIIYNVLEGVSVTVADNVAMGLGMVLFVILNYAGQRWVVFRKP
ncbi:MAG: GtrA family protein [Actinomycetaceae bacterium]|nr:GtrA family protein [Actinomycetaceae bacterium]